MGDGRLVVGAEQVANGSRRVRAFRHMVGGVSLE
jgi:hypothetical protein